NQFEGHEFGWNGFFKILRLYLQHFAGQSCSAFQVMGVSPEPVPETWATFTRLLGMSGAVGGQQVPSLTDAPCLAAIGEEIGPGAFPSALLRLSTPAPGLAHCFPIQMDQVYLSVRVFLYGPEGGSASSEAETAWQAWMTEHFPFPVEGT